ncbi:MAG: V-type proton ATPase subunit E [Candidatus Omnitrophica bacterium]|nr:V-type proton ATPase subunit E [Candidatus Omnitrophota bacterium]
MSQENERIGEGLISEIEKSAITRVEQIIQQAKSEAQKILFDAERNASQIIQNEKEKTENLLTTMRQQAESSIKIELKKLQLELKKEFTEKVFEKVRQMSSDLRNSPDYKQFLKNAILEAVEVIDKPELVIKFSFLDKNHFTSEFEKEILEICANELKKNVSIKFMVADFEDIGICGISNDGHILYENTFTARMNRLYEELYTLAMGEI